jgi:hypothetical protein
MFPVINVTLPVGVPDGEVTVAVIVTDCPYVEGFSEEAKEVAVGTLSLNTTPSLLAPPW